MRKEKKKENFLKENQFKFILTLIMAIISLYLFYNAIILLKQPTGTYMVEEGSLSQEEHLEGYIIRDEKVFQGQNYKNGIVQIKSEGDRVAVNEEIFRYYSNSEAELIQKISKLDEEINQALENESEVFNSDIALLETQIEAILNTMQKNNDIEKMNEYVKTINEYITKKAKIAGDLSPTGSHVKKLIAERTKYEAELNTNSEVIKTTMGGVLSYKVDGLEEVLVCEQFDYLNKQFLNNLSLKTGLAIATNQEKGKVVNNYKCYIAVSSDTEEAKNAKVDDSVSVRIVSNTEEIPATIVHVADNEDGSKLIVLEVKKKVEELINYRKISLELVWWNYKGLKISNDSIIEKDNLQYVIKNRAGYREKIMVKVLRSNAYYSIIENYTNDELKEMEYSVEEIKAMQSIKMYDEVISKPTEEMLQ